MSLFVVSSAQATVEDSPSYQVERTVSLLSDTVKDLDPKVLSLAVEAYFHAKAKGQVSKPLLTVIDYSLKSTLKRLWVFDIKQNKLLFHTYVSHGKGSGQLYAKNFSNRAGSHQSSLGVYVTGKTFQGDKGLSLRLDGKEIGFNDKAKSRAIVMHGAWYADPKFILRNGYAGRSWGCPALPTFLNKPIVEAIKKGSLLFAYYPNHNWLEHSSYLA